MQKPQLVTKETFLMGCPTWCDDWFKKDCSGPGGETLR